MMKNPDNTPEGRLVGSGTFKVDRELALSKLGQFQVDQRVSRLGLWLRCAVASGATMCSINGSLGAYEIRFDGNPFSLSQMKDPYQALFLPANPAGASGRWFALAFLNAFAPGVYLVEVASGGGKDRHRLRAKERGAEDVQPALDGETHTIIRIKWSILSLATDARHPSLDPLARGGAPQILRMTPIPIVGEGAFRQWGNIAPVGPSSGEAFGFLQRFIRKDACRILLKRTLNINLTGGRFFVSTYGVTIGAIHGMRAPATVTGWIDSPNLTLNASLAGVVANAQYDRLRKSFAKEILRFSSRGWSNFDGQQASGEGDA